MRKLLFYSHNLYGLGHIVRSLRIAEAALQIGGCECCLLTGCRVLDCLEMDPRIRLVRLPPVVQRGIVLEGASADSGPGVMSERGRQIVEFSRRWMPAAFLVDSLPLGLGGELRGVLSAARDENWNSRFVWGVPYAEGTRFRLPRSRDIRTCLAQYESAIAYTDPSSHEVFGEFQATDFLPPRCEYVGYVTDAVDRTTPARPPQIVGLTGGGVGGRRLLAWILAATESQRAAGSARLRFVVGALGDVEQAESLTAGQPNVELLATATVAQAVRGASLVIARAGYNSAYTLVRSELPLILVPLPTNDDEQYARARRLSRLPAVWMIDERQPAVEEELSRCVVAGLNAPRQSRRLPLNTDGACRAAAWLLQQPAAERSENEKSAR